ncbi:uncharacterized protein LOC106661532 isoform X4 [Cimex lectularius]|uniref:Uncharacterized protein n=1 Tax=Cimex lectularius TaxID=79782 RepID=A0A8I6R8I1_CIMLE|nr:uncharacterized protein LOC106661532 isoform X4 [Cimex lectularius]
MFKKTTRVTWEREYIEEEIERKQSMKKWYKYTNPYPDYRLGLLQMWFSFGAIWVTQLRYRTRNTRCIRLSLAIVIPFFLINGFLFTATSVLKAFNLKLWINILSYNTSQSEFYWGIGIVGIILIIVSLHGMYGIYGHRIWSSKVFTVMTFIYGQASLTVSASWLLLLQIESSKSFLNKSENMPEVSPYNGTESDEEFLDKFRDNQALNVIVEIVFSLSIVFIVAGILSAVLLIRDNNKKGFVELKS